MARSPMMPPPDMGAPMDDAPASPLAGGAPPYLGGGAAGPAAPPEAAPPETLGGGSLPGRMPSAPVHMGHRKGARAPIAGGRHKGHSPGGRFGR